jgi:glyoxylase-like metal-dependent hydrolase (beta-lactamase superfamily II)
MEVAPGIHRIDAPLGARVVSLVLFAGKKHSLLVDVGVDQTPHKELNEYLGANRIEAQRIRWAVVTHPDVDHFGGIVSMHELVPEVISISHRLDAPLIADYGTFKDRRGDPFRSPWGLHESAEALAWMRSVARPRPVELTVMGGERIDLGEDWLIEILHLPGHSYGHLGVYDPRSRTLAISDAVLGDAVRQTDGKPAFPPTYRYVDSYLGTISRCEGIRPELLLTGHYPTMDIDGADEFFAVSRAFVEKVDHVVLGEIDAAGERGLSLQELLHQANPKLGDWPMEGTEVALAFPVVGHLERMLTHGSITGARDGGAYRVKRAR